MNRVSTFRIVVIGCWFIFALTRPAQGQQHNQRPVSFGTTLPATCFPGDLFFKTNAVAGSNIYACVASPANTWVVQGIATLGGDVTGQPSLTTVTQLQGHAVAATTPQGGQSLTWNSSTNSWQPQTASESTTLGGDVVGLSGANTVTQIQGHPVVSTLPTVGQALVWNGTTWQPQTSNGTVSSVFGRTGPVVAAPNDYSFSQIGGALALNQIAPGGAISGQCLTWNANMWNPTSCGASMGWQLGDLAVTQTSNIVLTIGPSCSSTRPCNVRFGALMYSLTSPATATISSGTGNAYLYVASSGTLTVGHTMVASCSGSCIASTGVTSFPTDSIPLFLWHATNGVWDPSGSDQRAFLSTKDIMSGTGLISKESTGGTTIAVDQSVTPQKWFGSGAPGTVNGSEIGDIYIDTTNRLAYTCSVGSSPCATWAGNGGIDANNTPGPSGHVLRSNGTHYVDAAIQAVDIPPLNYQTPITTGTTTQYIRGDLSLATFPTTWAWGNLSGVPAFATVATSGSYSDLSNKPSYQAPITTGTTAQFIRGDLSLATFPTTWAWGSLTGIPSAFTPSGHASSHAAGGSDPVTLSLSRLTVSTVTNGQCLGNNSGAWGTFLCGGSVLPSVTNVLKGNGSGGAADTKVAITAPITAWTITPAADNQTTIVPAGTLLSNGGPLGTPSSGNASNLTSFPSNLVEPALGNPGTPGFVLSSTSGGVRSWIAPGPTSQGAANSLNVSGGNGSWTQSDCTWNGTGLGLTCPSASGVSGMVALPQGTANTAPANSTGFQAPTSMTTGFLNTLWSTPTTGFVRASAVSPYQMSVAPIAATELPATPVPAPGTSITLTAPRGYAICTGTCFVTVPAPAAGYEFCVMTDDNVSAAITLSALGSSAMYENTARTGYGTAGTGTFTATAANGNKVCLVGRDPTHYLTISFAGSWTAN